MIGFIIGIIIFIGLAIATIIDNKNNKWISREDFEINKRKMKPNCSQNDFNEFMEFLRSYGGGYIKRQDGRIVYQDYLAKEKGDLKGIFFNIVVPNPNINVVLKEEYRKYLVTHGVRGVEDRPNYETRDSKLTNKKKTEEEYRRKEVGNVGEELVRSSLDKLDNVIYSVINGPKLKLGDTVMEFDHIVIGTKGVFIIETKAFGMTGGHSTRAALFIDEGDKWILRKNKNNRELESPTKQIMQQVKLLETIINSCQVIVHPILAISNSEMFIKNNIELPYDVVRVDELRTYISKFDDDISVIDKRLMLMDINECRIN